MSDTQNIERHIMSVLVDNEPGVLARGDQALFSGQGYNIESLTVAETQSDLGPVAHFDRHLWHSHGD